LVFKFSGFLSRILITHSNFCDCGKRKSMQPQLNIYPTIYESTTAAAHFDKSFQPALDPNRPPPMFQKRTEITHLVDEALERPLTFWSHQFVRGAHTVYSSTFHGLHPQAAIRNSVIGHTAVHQASSQTSKAPLCENAFRKLSFGRHVDFSTPIAEAIKVPQKP
jgi:hypothetical protein